MEAFLSKSSELKLDWIQVEVSAVCNASCAYCVLDCYRDQWQGGLMDMKTFERIKPYFASAGLVFLQGWGEPLLHSQFRGMVEMVKAAGSRVGFTTNGTLLNEENIVRLLPLNIDIMGISLAGTSAITHNRFRQGCDFDEVESNVLELKRTKEKLGVDAPEMHIAFILLASNWRDLKDLPLLAAKWGVKQVVVSNLTFIGKEDLQGESLLNRPELWQEVRAALESAKTAAEGQGVDLQFYGPEIGEPLAVCRENVLNACFITWRGDVTPCVMTGFSLSPEQPATHYFKGNRYDVESVVFGNVNDETLHDIWISKTARIFHSHYQRRLRMPDPIGREVPLPCRHCYKLIEQ